MAVKPLTSEEIALTEKKMNMTLDDIIQMSKKTETKAKKPQRAPNKNLNNGANDKSGKIRPFMDSRASLRQGALAKRRSSFKGDQFSMAKMAAQKAAMAPIHNQAFNSNRASRWHKPRTGAPPHEKVVPYGDSTFKQRRQKQDKPVPNQKHQTLDSRFASMKEQRFRSFAPQDNAVKNNRGRQHRLPWQRGKVWN